MRQAVWYYKFLLYHPNLEKKPVDEPLVAKAIIPRDGIFPLPHYFGTPLPWPLFRDSFQSRGL